MNYLKLFHLSFIIICVILTACSIKVADKITWQSSPILIDGNASEYQNLNSYSNETKMFYSLSNDKTNLYLCLKISDETMQIKILNAGMEVWIDAPENTTDKIGILYPRPNCKTILIGGMNPSINDEYKNPYIIKLKQNFLIWQTEMQLIGFKYSTKGLVPLIDKSGTKVKIDWDISNAMIYKAVIPLKAIYQESISDSSTIFSLTINVNSMQMKNITQDFALRSDKIFERDKEIKNTNATSERNTFVKKFKIEIREQ